jgi:cardiolipin synthase
VPTEPVLEALKAAALSGVDVRLMVPFRTDARLMGPVNESFFSECLAAGIRIFRWKGGTFIHAKTFVCDDYLTMVGSANIDYRSFMINHEINTFLYDRPAALQYKSIFLEDQEVSEEVTWDRWTQRSWFRKLRERIFRLFAPLL